MGKAKEDSKSGKRKPPTGNPGTRDGKGGTKKDGGTKREK